MLASESSINFNNDVPKSTMVRLTYHTVVLYEVLDLSRPAGTPHVVSPNQRFFRRTRAKVSFRTTAPHGCPSCVLHRVFLLHGQARRPNSFAITR
jgi:hypothetical protein